MFKLLVFCLTISVGLLSNEISLKNFDAVNLNQGERLIKNFNGDLMDVTEFSNTLLVYNMKKDSFKFCVQFINKMINEYGEDSIYTKIAYLFLASHYISYDQIEPAKELLSFVDETMENKAYEKASHLKQLLFYLKAGLYEKMGKYNDAYSFYKESLRLTNKVLDPKHLFEIQLLNAKSKIELELSLPNKALSTIQKVLSLEDKLGKNEGRDEKISTTINFAKIYEMQKDFLSAADILKNEMDIFLKNNDIYFPKMIELLTTYSLQTLRLKAYIPTIFSSKLSLDVHKKLSIKDSEYSILNYFYIGFSEKELGHYNKAKKNLESALSLLENIDDKSKDKLQYINQIKSLLKDIDRKMVQSNSTIIKK